MRREWSAPPSVPAVVVAVAVCWLLGAACPASCAARDAGLAYGFKLGAAVSNLVGDDAEIVLTNPFDLTERVSPSRRFSIAGGGFLLIPLADGMWLQPELLYVSKGGHYGGQYDDLDVELGYLELPLLLRLDLLGSSRNQLYLLLGPSFAGLVSAKVHDLDVNADLRKLDTGLTCGVGLDWNDGPVHSILEVRYTLGGANLDETGLGLGEEWSGLNDDDAGAEVRNGSLAVLMGFAF